MLYEIDTRVLLGERARKLGRRATLDDAHQAKSVVVSDEGAERSRELFERYFDVENEALSKGSRR